MSVKNPAKAKDQSKRPPDLANAEIALNRAAATARTIAKQTGTAVVIFEDGEIREQQSDADAY